MGGAAHLAIDDGREGEVVEYLGAVPPHGDRAVLAEALVVEAVHLGDLPGLVVPSDQGDPVWVPDLGDYRGSEGHQTKCSPRTAFKSRLCSTLI